MNHQELRRAIQEIAAMDMSNRSQVVVRLRALATQIERGEAQRSAPVRVVLPPVRSPAWHRALTEVREGVSIVEIARRYGASVREISEWLNSMGGVNQRRPRRNGSGES